MSIRDQIKAHLGKEIFLLAPLDQGPRPRTMFVSKDVYAAAEPPWKNLSKGRRRRHATMRAVLDSFTHGDWLIVSEDPDNKTKDTILARVKPLDAEVWDIRCLEPTPGIRVFGRFIARNEFVALTYGYREDMNGRAFDAEVERFRSKWQDLFPHEAIFGGRKINEYLSENYRVV